VERVDVVVLGSGYGGSIPAYRMAREGRSVVVLERGRRMTPAMFEQSDDPKHIAQILEIVVANNNAALRVGRMVGGASINMDGGMFRAPAKTFTAKDEQGRPYWPAGIDRKALDPYYEEAEAMMKVRQMGWEEIPKAGGLFAEVFAKSGARVDRARMNYTDCVHCGFCSVGCRFEKKQSLDFNYIPKAEEAGASFREGCFVHHLEADGTGFIVHYSKDGQAQSIRGEVVFLAGGGIHSPAILHRSRKELTQLPESIGKGLNFNGEASYLLFLPEDYGGLEDYYCYMGMENAGVMCFEYWEDEGRTLHPGGGLEPTIFAAQIQAEADDLLPKRAWGAEYKRFVEKVYPHRVLAFASLGLAPSTAEVAFSTSDQPSVKAAMNEGYAAFLDRMEKILESVASKVRGKLIHTVPRNQHGTTNAHHLSSCRMGEDPASSVLSPDGYVWGYPNLFCCDASAIPYALGVNPALTISANALRVCDYVAKNR
jgi:choline dehydrogenase-like flavoprotein